MCSGRQAARSVGESNTGPDGETGERRSGTDNACFVEEPARPFRRGSFAAFAQVLGKPKP